MADKYKNSESTDHITAIDYYWRPGCPFCEGLNKKLKAAKIPLNKHNIWDSPKAAATVRSIANGNETVPTVVIGPAKLVNPSIKQVQAALTEFAPHLAS